MTDVFAAPPNTADPVAPSRARIAAQDASPTATRGLSMPVLWAAGLFGALLVLAALFGRIMDYGIRRDEMLFVAPAELLGTWSLYSDFFYNHLPYSAWMFRASNLVFGDAGLLFSARLVVFGGWLILLGATFWGVRRLSGSPLLAAFSAVALVTHETLLGQAGMAASNNLLPLSFSALATALFLVEFVSRRPRALPLFCAGLSLSIAIGLKISAVVLVPPLLLAVLLLPRSLTFKARLRQVFGPAMLGGVLGALPLFFLLVRDPGLFLAHVVGFHTGPHPAYWDAFAHTEPTLALGLVGKVLLAQAAWLSGSALLLLLAVLATGWIVVTGRKHGEEGLQYGAILTVLGLMLCTMVMSFVPTPGFPQYFAPPLVFMPFLAALLMRPIARSGEVILAPTLLAGMILMVILALPRLAPGGLALRAMERTEVGQFHLGGQAIAAALAQSDRPDGPVATLMPLYPLEAGLPVYAELATGIFAYRSAAFTPPELAEAYVMAGPDDLAALFERTPPAAILIGYEPDLEAPLRDYAETHGFTKVAVEGLKNRYGAGILLVPGGEAAQ